jgi:hypothetical protein
MSKKPPHVQWFINTGTQIKTSEGKEIEVWEFLHQKNTSVLSEWATHFRNHYCLDSQIDDLVSGTGKTKKQYLESIKFPDEREKPGPSIRSGDFAEILVADYLEYICNYWVPRTRYIDKTVRNESTKGSDTIGIKIMRPSQYSPEDELIIFEVKASFSEFSNNRLQDAVTASANDEVRKGETLNSIKQRYLDKNESGMAKKIERFQNITDHPYKNKSGAAAVLENKIFTKTDFSYTSTSSHYNSDNLFLIVIKGNDMMNLVHELYRRAADEA